MRGEPEHEAKAWLDRLAAINRKRSRFQDMAAERHITFQELGSKLHELEGARKSVERELEALRDRWDAITQLERDRDTLLEHYARLVPEALAELSGEERHQIYRMLCLEVYVISNGDLEIRGVLSEDVLYPDGNATRCPQCRVRPRLRWSKACLTVPILTLRLLQLHTLTPARTIADLCAPRSTKLST